MRDFLKLGVALLAFGVGSALAGAGGAPPGGGGGPAGGTTGAEPELWFLMLFSLVPGVWFARKALAARRAVEQ